MINNKNIFNLIDSLQGFILRLAPREELGHLAWPGVHVQAGRDWEAEPVSGPGIVPKMSCI